MYFKWLKTENKKGTCQIEFIYDNIYSKCYKNMSGNGNRMRMKSTFFPLQNFVLYLEDATASIPGTIVSLWKYMSFETYMFLSANFYQLIFFFITLHQQNNAVIFTPKKNIGYDSKGDKTKKSFCIVQILIHLSHINSENLILTNVNLGKIERYIGLVGALKYYYTNRSISDLIVWKNPL